jgi:DNA primase
MRDYILSLVEKELGPYRWTGETHIVCKCPIHKGGQEHKPSFTVNVDTGQWYCFTGCGGGSLYSLLRELGHSRRVIDRILAPIKHLLGRKQKVRHGNRHKDPFRGDYLLPEELLGLYDHEPLDLVDEGFDPELLELLDIGYDRPRRRITYPLRDLYGNLIGLVGRMEDDDTDRSVGKYKWYTSELKELYEDYIRPRHNFLWNMDRIFEGMQNSDKEEVLIVCEGFKACMWCIQHGYPKSVALMSASISAVQAELIEKLSPVVVLFLDGDDAGQVGTLRIGEQLRSRGLDVLVVVYPEGADEPDALDAKALDDVLRNLESFNTWKRNLPQHIKDRARTRRRKK